MMKKLIANLVVITVIAFSVLPFLDDFRYGVAIAPVLIILSILLLMLFWRIKIFPKTGYIVFGYSIISGAIGLLLGASLSWVAMYVLWKYFNLIIGSHGLGFAVIFWSSFCCCLLGIVIGYLIYRKRERCLS